jgi:predicted lipoprotein with Yx(FWY)xxD motif
MFSGSSAVAVRERWVAVAAVVFAAMGVAGCGSSGGGVSAPVYAVQAKAVPGLGEIVVDGKGFTLYSYAPDHQGPSRCTGFCAQQWPPLVLPHGVDRPMAGPGVKAALLGTVRRPNGQLQETYDKWPLYLWEGDLAPGQATGQADGMGLWYAVSVTGAVDRGVPTS